MTTTADVVVIGLGAVGSATLHRLALRGVPRHRHRPLRPPARPRLHPWRDPHHPPLRRRRPRLRPPRPRSHAIWRELEAETGETLFSQVGMIVIGEGDGAPSHGQPGFPRQHPRIAASHAIPHEILDSADIRRRYPSSRSATRSTPSSNPAPACCSRSAAWQCNCAWPRPWAP